MKPVRILVVDDSVVIRKLLSVTLSKEATFEVVGTAGGELEGVDLARFTFELDDAVGEIFELVSTVFGASPVHA